MIQLWPVMLRTARLVSGFRRATPSPEALFEFETNLQDLLREAGRLIVQWTVNHLEPEDLFPQKMPPLFLWDGEYYRRRKKFPLRRLHCLFGPITLRRFYYQPLERCGRGLFPLEIQLGIVTGTATPALADTVARLAADLTQRQTLDRLRQQGVAWGTRTLRKVVAAMADSMSEHRHQAQVQSLLSWLSMAAAGKGPRRFVLSVGRDGVMIPIVKSQKYKEAAAATVSVMDRWGRRLGTVYLGQMPEAHQTTLGDDLTRLLKDVRSCWEGPLPRLVYVTDCGHHPTVYFEEVLSRMIHPRRPGEYLDWEWVVDYYHACQYITKLGEAMKPVSGMMWMDFADEYDFNRRTRQEPPQGVNRDTFGDARDYPDHHALTIGDLCFVALGQIVNRRFAATRYQPSGGLIVSSPTYSEALRKVAIADWAGLKEERHKRLLTDDFTTPDHVGRRIGAYLRLSFYYPDTVERLVLHELAKPTFDVFAINDFCRNTLYKTPDEGERQRKYDRFIRERGSVYSVGVMDQLFDDLDRLEAHKRGALSPPLTEFATQPREMLIQLFGKPTDVKSADRPDVDSVSESERARLIGALIHDDSTKIGDVVKQLFLESPDDGYFAPACLRCLASRGYSDFLVEQLSTMDVANPEVKYLHKKCIEAISTSREESVRDKLREIVETTRNASYFMAAIPAVDDADKELVFGCARDLLEGLPEDTDQGEALLKMIGERYPDRAKPLYKAFLSTGSTKRSKTMCDVLWYGNEMSPELLAPLLDDTRPLDGFSIPMRVCDRAAQAISHTSEKISFDSDWSTTRKDQQIEKIKEYCRPKDR